MCVQRYIEVCSRYHCSHGKAMSITSFECVALTLVTQHAKRIRRWSVHLHCIFPHYLINATIFRKNVIERNACVLVFSTTFVWNIPLTLRRIQGDITINIHRPSYTLPLILVRFKWNLNFLDRFFKNIQI